MKTKEVKNKKNLLKSLLPMILIMILLSFAACSKSDTQNTITDSNKNNDEAKRVNPLGISSTLYEKCEKDQFLDEAGNVKYLASLLNQNELGDSKGYVNITVCDYTEANILIDYIYGNDKDFAEGTGLERHFSLLEKDTGNIVKELIIKGNDEYAEVKSNCISVESTKNGVFSATTYDFNLNEIAKFTIDETSATVTSDGKRMYYVNKHRICMYDAMTGENKIFDSKNQFSTSTIIGVSTDELGHDYVKIAGTAADYNLYNFIYDTHNGEIDYVGCTDTVIEIYDGFGIGTQYSEDWSFTSWIIGVSDDKVFSYDITDDMKARDVMDNNVQLMVLDNGDLLFSYGDVDKVYVDVYDIYSGTIKGTTVIDIRDIRREPIKEVQGQEMEYYTDNMWVSSKSYYMADNVMLLTLGDFYGTEYYLQWQMEDTVDNNMITVSEYEVGALSVDISDFNNELLLPGELSDEFKTLREFADRLEKEYHIEINIGEECADICETYLIYPVVDYSQTEAALNKLEIALNKYPQNFFAQLKYEGVDGIDVHFATDILGTTDETLSIAGGLKCIEDGKLKLILDIDDEGVFDTTFHHELCHAIDDVISYRQMFVDEAIFSEDEWNKLNPYEDMYSLSYVDWGKEEYWQYSYDNEISEPDFDGGVKNAYFVDTYAMTYPTEDRARIFENIMREEGRYIDFENSPNLLRKVNYFARCIRATFDTTGWEDILWEVYLEENIVDN